jgi:hypothetical protein
MAARVSSVAFGPARWKVQPPWKLTSPASNGRSSRGASARTSAIIASPSSPISLSRPSSMRWLPGLKESGPISSDTGCNGTHAVTVRSLDRGQ